MHGRPAGEKWFTIARGQHWILSRRAYLEIELAHGGGWKAYKKLREQGPWLPIGSFESEGEANRAVLKLLDGDSGRKYLFAILPARLSRGPTAGEPPARAFDPLSYSTGRENLMKAVASKRRCSAASAKAS
jgi:hypothetical protein